MKNFNLTSHNEYESKVYASLTNLCDKHPCLVLFLLFGGGALMVLFAVIAIVYLIALPFWFLL